MKISPAFFYWQVGLLLAICNNARAQQTDPFYSYAPESLIDLADSAAARNAIWLRGEFPCEPSSLPQAKGSFACFQGDDGMLQRIADDFSAGKDYAEVVNHWEEALLDSREHITYALDERDAFGPPALRAVGGSSFDLQADPFGWRRAEAKHGRWYFVLAENENELRAVYLEEPLSARPIPETYLSSVCYCRALLDPLQGLRLAYAAAPDVDSSDSDSLILADEGAVWTYGTDSFSCSGMFSAGDHFALTGLDDWFSMDDDLDLTFNEEATEELLSPEEALYQKRAAFGENPNPNPGALSDQYFELSQIAAYAGDWNIFLRAHLAGISESTFRGAYPEDAEHARNGFAVLSALGINTCRLAPGLAMSVAFDDRFASWEESAISPKALVQLPEAPAAAAFLNEAVFDEKLDLFNRYNLLNYYVAFLLEALRLGHPVNGDIERLALRKKELPLELGREIDILETQYRKHSRAGQ